MATEDKLKKYVTAIAEAIREKEGSTELINPQDFATRIKDLQVDSSGGDSTQETKWNAGIHAISFFERDPLGGDGTYYLYGFSLDSYVDTDFTWHTLIEEPYSIYLYYVTIPYNTAPTIKDGYVYYDGYPVYHDLEDEGWMGSTFINPVKASDIVEKGKTYYIDKGNGI